MKRRALLPVYVCAAVALATGHLAYAQDQVVTRVTDAMLQDPDPADWLSWRRTLDGWGVQPARPDRPEQRGRATARLVLGSPTRGVADDADRARRRHVCRETRATWSRRSTRARATSSGSIAARWTSDFRSTAQMRSLAVYQDLVIHRAPRATRS